MKGLNVICFAFVGYIQTVVNGQWCTTDSGCPAGSYSNSGCSSCWVNTESNNYQSYNGQLSALTCNCPSNSGSITSTLHNAWACNGCIANVNGALACQLPYSATNGLGYQQLCWGCAMNNGVLSCKNCNNVFGQFNLDNACGCQNGIQFSNSQLQCGSSSTSAPTNKPTNKPLNPAPICANYWLTLQTATGAEAAPQKSCSQFQTVQGCQYQNWCCFQYAVGSTSSGTCVTASSSVPDCPTLSQSQCQSGNALTYCQWTNYGGGLCQRLCPGDPKQMCVA